MRPPPPSGLLSATQPPWITESVLCTQPHHCTRTAAGFMACAVEALQQAHCKGLLSRVTRVQQSSGVCTRIRHDRTLCTRIQQGSDLAHKDKAVIGACARGYLSNRILRKRIQQ
ncbi:hypothetical protein NDU88_007497 [Pleurodeles waltl]|uniref:Uncharacterized protein n=1 Tax=Pleurodeles waltl TaxID=8319 RepID=A0AAV7TZX2_PLEWA|nr:hypothetical protein NDU88_007497 [Pleurodeles waltl]